MRLRSHALRKIKEIQGKVKLKKITRFEEKKIYWYTLISVVRKNLEKKNTDNVTRKHERKLLYRSRKFIRIIKNMNSCIN